MGKMRKEIAAGLTILSLTLLIFGSMLYRRMRPPSDAADQDLVMTARELPMPIPSHSKKPTLVAAGGFAGDAETPPGGTGDWAPRQQREAELAAAQQANIPPRESYLPRDEALLQEAATEAAIPAGEPLAENPYAAPPAENPYAPPAEDPYAQPRAAAEELAEGAPAGSVDPSQQQFDRELGGEAGRGEAGRDAMQPIAEPERAEDLIRGQLPDNQAAEAIAASGELPSEAEMPRAGLRSRFPHSEDAAQDGYDPVARQPGHLQHEAGQASGHAHAQVIVENGKYVVQPNDNYWIVSEKVYGDGGYFKAIYEHNRLRYPRADKLQVGDVLDVPHTSVLQERYAELCPKQRKAPPARSTLVPASTRHRVGERVYVVGEGDTLFDIAKYELGKATRWAEIYELNRDVLGEEFDYLRPGTELVLPPQDRRDAESVTRGRDPALQR